MIDSRLLLADLQQMVKRLEADLRERADEVADVRATLEREHATAKQANRTADVFEIWRDDYLTQVAVAWVLGCVFVRFLEDNGLIDEPRLSGAGDRLRKAKDHHTLYFQDHPHESDREYLLDVFREVAQLPAAEELFDARHNLIWEVGISGDGATALLDFWQKIDPATGQLVHDFTSNVPPPYQGGGEGEVLDTRFLGDLYQDLSEAARKRYALLQTPIFVEEFILDRTLTPAIQEFGFREVRMLDPACGSGHFLLGGFERLFRLWAQHEPRTNTRELAQRVLNQVYGVDLNPFAVAIARFRLLLMALRASSITRLKDAPAFHIHVEAGDSLLHGRRFTATGGPTPDLYADHVLRHVYFPENREQLDRILGQQYHVVVGNPPYITVKDKALNQAYRVPWGSCHRQYSMAVPFTERFFDLALAGPEGAVAGFVGMITANSFMKREFGKKLIEQFIPRWDLTHAVDTSGAYIPGHDTPTVILFGRHRAPVADTVRAVLGIRGEPQTPDDPAKGLVWSAIFTQIDRPGSLSEFVSAADLPRANFAKHPWSIGGGGAAELKDLLDDRARSTLEDKCDEIGFVCITRADDVYFTPAGALKRARISDAQIIVTVEGDRIRDWAISDPNTTLFPYDSALKPLVEEPTSPVIRFLWPYRTSLWLRREPNGNHRELGLTWYEWSRFQRERFEVPLCIAFAFIATHNHFVLDRGGKAFKQSAPVIKLPPDATEDDHLALLGLLNSSTGCFWMKQVFHNKGLRGQAGGITSEPWEQFLEFDGTKIKQFPIPVEEVLDVTRRLDPLAREFKRHSPNEIVAHCVPTDVALATAKARGIETCGQMIALQEELDWQCYRLYGLLDGDLCYPAEQVPGINLGERAFEIVMARQMAAGELETKWFERHGSTPITEIPAHWAQEYRQLVQRRIDAIASNSHIRLIEQPVYKRRWNTEAWEEQQERALREWLLNRLEDARHWPSIELTTCAKLADRVRQDTEFMQVAELYRGRADLDLTALVTELVESEAVPFLPVLRYKATGLRKRAVWERTWDLQRREDASAPSPAPPAGEGGGEGLGEIPVPPKYTSADFRKSTYWRLRGKLDVPKERFIIYPHAERDADPTPVIAWAGWDHLQQAQALAGYYVQMKEREGWSPQRLTPLLAGLLELIPWLKQWHNAIDPTYGVGLGDYFADFVQEEARALQLTAEQIRAWSPS